MSTWDTEPGSTRRARHATTGSATGRSNQACTFSPLCDQVERLRAVNSVTLTSAGNRHSTKDRSVPDQRVSPTPRRRPGVTDQFTASDAIPARAWAGTAMVAAGRGPVTRNARRSRVASGLPSIPFQIVCANASVGASANPSTASTTGSRPPCPASATWADDSDARKGRGNATDIFSLGRRVGISSMSRTMRPVTGATKSTVRT
jgi:hypothetical protein